MSTEEWRAIPGHDGYEVSDFGNVRKSGTKELVDQFAFQKPNYQYVKLEGEFLHVHRLVLLGFIGPSNLECNHKDGDKTNNHLDNLEYCTHADNIRHAYETGLNDPQKHGKHALTDKQRDRIHYLYWVQALSPIEIARVFKISRSAVSRELGLEEYIQASPDAKVRHDAEVVERRTAAQRSAARAAAERTTP